MPERDRIRRSDAEQELAKATSALDRDEIEHAAVHIAQAIAADPGFDSAYQELERVHALAPRPEELFRVDSGEVYIGNLAARAHLSARAGRPDDALEMLMHAAATAPAVPWLSGGAMAVPDVRAGLDPRRAGVVLGVLAARLRGPIAATQRAALAPFLEIAGAAADAEPADIELAVRLAVFAWAVDANAQAARWLARAESLTPGPLGSIMMGHALRDAERPAEAEAAWARAVEADPDNLDVYVDLARLLSAQHRRRDADGWLARALARDPGHGRTRAARRALAYLDSRDVCHLVTLVDEAREGGYADRIQQELTWACDKKTWLNRVPMPTEVTVMMANKVASDRSAGKQVTVHRSAVTAIEPPSSAAAVRVVLPDLRVQVLACPPPDLRIPVAPVTYRVWRYDGTNPVPAVPAPSPEAAQTLRTVANLPWSNPLAGFEGAVGLAGLPLPDLLGLLCHVPPAPENMRWGRLCRTTPTYWPRLAQVWACLGILYHEPDQPWMDSIRRAVLVDLANGIEDWTSDAALFALVTAAWRDPGCRADVASIVAGRFAKARATTQHRMMTIAPSIAELVLITPGVSRADARRARRLIRDNHRPARTRVVVAWRRLLYRLGR